MIYILLHLQHILPLFSVQSFYNMVHQGRLPVLLLTVLLCLSPWPVSGQCPNSVTGVSHYTSNYDAQCYDLCQKQKEDYYWCHTKNGYDYCSPRHNFDYKGNACHKDYPCEKYGKTYYWCYLEKGGWDYCGRLEPKSVIHQTYYLNECIDDCQYNAKDDYFWCHIAGNTWGYCSPFADFTYKNEPCTTKCEKNGKSYSWCKIKGGWDYCGIVSFGDCYLTSRRKRQIGESNQVCSVVQDNVNYKFTIRPDNNAITSPNRSLRTEAADLINRFENQGLGNQARSNLVTSQNLRIDLQGLFNRGNQRFYNLQIQWNIQRSNRRSTTLAQIMVPIDTPAGIMREAFRLSLERQARIEVQTEPVTRSCRRPQ